VRPFKQAGSEVAWKRVATTPPNRAEASSAQLVSCPCSPPLHPKTLRVSTAGFPLVDTADHHPFYFDKLAMSGIWGWFGSGAAQKRKDTPKNVILDLRTQLDMLQKREVHLTRQIEEQEQIARKNVSTNKTGTVISWMPRKEDVG
jgi:hypothetical protein